MNEAIPRPRELVCEACGARFGCVLDGPCWCAQEAYRMPLPKAGEGPADCLCPSCLRIRAAALRQEARPETKE